MATLKEKIGYGFGDMSSSMFWKIFSYYLPFFYSNIFGLSLADAGLLMLVTRIWDAVSDPMMGVIADRTHTRWGKYRPYLLWIAAPFAIAGILLFTTPDMGTTGKLVWAYVTYILMMTVYTAINVPYGAMLGVMTDDSNTKTVFSSYRMFFAYGGSFIALGAWEPLCNWFKSMDYSNASSWQYAMVCIATLCFLGFLFCFSMTREHVKSVASESIGKDVKSLVRNSPWWILNGAALLSNFFNTVRGATAAYFFKDYISANAFLDFGVFNLVLYAGLFLMVGEVCNMIGVALAVPLSMKFGKKSTYIISLVCLVVLSVLFFFVPNVFSALGFYPVSPGVPVYTIGSPLFDKSEIQLANGKVFTMIAHGVSWENKYIQSAKLNGAEYNKTWFTHEDVMKGGTLELFMGDRPNKKWGVGEGANPPSGEFVD